MNTINRCAYLDRYHKFTIKEESLPKLKPDEVLVKIVSNGICGSDIHFFRDGKLGNFEVTIPYIPGHECSGIIVNVGSLVDKHRIDEHVAIEPGISCGRCYYCKIGRYNICPNRKFLSEPPNNGTFCDYITIRADLAHALPKKMNLQYGSFAEPTAVALHAVNRSNFINGATGVVLGVGPIGLLVSQVFKIAGGGKLICIDRLDQKLQLAKNLGADEVINSSKDDIDFENIGDIVFETAGSPATTTLLFNIAKRGGSIVQVGWPTGNIVKMDISKFIEKELTYLGSTTYANVYQTAIQWIYEKRINVKDLITCQYKFKEIQKAFNYASTQQEKVIKIIIEN